jgi:hypothetical protein
VHALLRLLVLLVFGLGANSPVGAESLRLIDYDLQDQFEQARGIKPRFPVPDLSAE